MKNLLSAVLFTVIVLMFTSCCCSTIKTGSIPPDRVISDASESSGAESELLKKGDELTISGIVDYSDEASDIGAFYCSVTLNEEIEYQYTDIYGEESKWLSNVFYTKGADTKLLKEYVGKTVNVSGIFDAECHGIPYITEVKILP